ncbi:TetR/AcrR family transcriptional regulator [Anaerovorax odorimutans]|uniref:TetR/AcrR family transcriptional regulator n=1 Tax=Anaerovorax odorimutans TaxID=109327 RepID=A0ABT1RLU2_9FIRM|nr:TetR/AcrR family transcriptional regulator [Anaerovorax odorimutans]MCQ4636156.1 TetR/AcrR family transcriptional regulator [Anaerovorax odorimutans]
MNEKFFNLTAEKQMAIVNAALHVFARNSYKKASTEEIARLAGISKSLLFHYFENKNGLYFYVYQYAEKAMLEGMKDYYDADERDFFKVLISAQMAKAQVLRRHPALIEFLMNAYLENDDAVETQMDSRFKDLIASSREAILARTDTCKFKDEISVAQALDIIFWMSDGFIRSRTEAQLADIETLNEEFLFYMELLRRQFYKEEYL